MDLLEKHTKKELCEMLRHFVRRLDIIESERKGEEIWFEMREKSRMLILDRKGKENKDVTSPSITK